MLVVVFCLIFEEVIEVDFVLYVVDFFNSDYNNYEKIVYCLLEELNVMDILMLIVYNKEDM